MSSWDRAKVGVASALCPRVWPLGRWPQRSERPVMCRPGASHVIRDFHGPIPVGSGGESTGRGYCCTATGLLVRTFRMPVLSCALCKSVVAGRKNPKEAIPDDHAWLQIR